MVPGSVLLRVRRKQMSETADRFRRKKPVISAEVVIAEHFEAMDAEHADLMAMLAELNEDSGERFVTPYFFVEDDPQFKEWWYQHQHSRHYSNNALFLDMIYDEEAERECEEDAYDRRCEDAHADRYDHYDGFGGY